MSSDQELDPDQLPRGHTPIWIQPPEGASPIEMMERVLKIPELKQYNNNVTALRYGAEVAAVKDMCKKLGYKQARKAQSSAFCFEELKALKDLRL